MINKGWYAIKPNPTINLNSFKLLSTKARKSIKEVKKRSWQNYVFLSMEEFIWFMIWKKIRNVFAKTQPTPQTPHEKQATSPKDIADLLAETFSTNSSLKNANGPFLTFKHNVEKRSFNYNIPFILTELIKPSKNHTTQQSAQLKSIANFLNIY